LTNTPCMFRFQGDSSTVMYRHHIDNLVFGSQLAINNSQEAVFAKNGRLLDVFGPGTHTLAGRTLPYLYRYFTPSAPFPCELYFVNKETVHDILWGTNPPIPIEDPKYRIIVNVQACGQIGIRISDSRLFISKISAGAQQYSVEAFKTDCQTKAAPLIRQAIANAIATLGISVVEISANMQAMSAEIVPSVNSALRSLGLEASYFYAETITTDSDDLNRLIKTRQKQAEALSSIDLDAERIKRISEANAYARMTEGYTYHDERRYDILSSAAKNKGSAAFANGNGGANVIDSQLNDIANSVMGGTRNSSASAQNRCTKCNATIAEGSKFCTECGTPRAEKKKFCPQCGAVTPPGSKFCTSCGARFG